MFEAFTSIYGTGRQRTGSPGTAFRSVVTTSPLDTSTAIPPVESSANLTPFAPTSQQAELFDTSFPDPKQGFEFNPPSCALRLKMLAKSSMLVCLALGEVKKEFRAPARSPRAKATRPANKAKAVVVGAFA